jgi:anti-sigma regulatory factor (Ser/Thr protein kinase)
MEGMSLFSPLVPIDDDTRVAQVRRAAVAAARSQGLEEHACEETAIIATEVATNLLKYATGGAIQISGLSAEGRPGVEILAIDRGPGLGNFQAHMEDGVSTGGSMGTGLGAIKRLADVFDAYSQPGRGTILLARKFPRHAAGERKERWVFGSVRAAYPGEAMCGDNWCLRAGSYGPCILVADGLGHGILAADASSAAVAAFQKSSANSAAGMVEDVHLSLRATRGAAVAVTCIDDRRRTVSYAGLGNIHGVLLGGVRAQVMVSHNGTAGLEARRFQEFNYALPADATLVMHSDGLVTNWSADTYPGLLRRHPAIIAGILYRDASRGRDDICVVVGRRIQE